MEGVGRATPPLPKKTGGETVKGVKEGHREQDMSTMEGKSKQSKAKQNADVARDFTMFHQV